MSVASAVKGKILWHSTDDEDHQIQLTLKMARSENPKLPQDAIVQILARLPTEHLLRVSCLSKSWLRTIRQPFFRSLHSRILSCEADHPSPFVVLRDGKDDPKFVLVSLSDLERGRPSRAIPLDNPVFRPLKCYSNTCNGLICMSPIVIDQHPMLVWNPLMGEYSALPIVDPHVRERKIPSRLMTARTSRQDPATGEMRVVSEYNPLTGKDITAPLPDDEQLYLLRSCGLGLSPSTGEYKVVRVSYGCVGWDNHHPHKIEVYTLEADRPWRIAQRLNTDRHHSQPLYAEGKLYWTACAYGKAPSAICFDIATEELMVTTPTGLPEHIDFCQLVRLGSCIAVIDVREEGHDDVISVWVLNAGGSWTERCKFSVYYRMGLTREALMYAWECEGGLVFRFSRFVVFYDERDGSRRAMMVPNMEAYAGKRCVEYRPSLMAPAARVGGCEITDGFAAKRFIN